MNFIRKNWKLSLGAGLALAAATATALSIIFFPPALAFFTGLAIVGPYLATMTFTSATFAAAGLTALSTALFYGAVNLLNFFYKAADRAIRSNPSRFTKLGQGDTDSLLPDEGDLHNAHSSHDAYHVTSVDTTAAAAAKPTVELAGGVSGTSYPFEAPPSLTSYDGKNLSQALATFATVTPPSSPQKIAVPAFVPASAATATFESLSSSLSDSTASSSVSGQSIFSPKAAAKPADKPHGKKGKGSKVDKTAHFEPSASVTPGSPGESF